MLSYNACGNWMRYAISNGTFMTIIGILRWFSLQHLCSAIQEPSVSVIYRPASVCVCSLCVWSRCVSDASGADSRSIRLATVQVQISSGLRVSAGAAGCFQHHGQRHQQQQQQQHQTNRRVKPVLRDYRGKTHVKSPIDQICISVKDRLSHYLMESNTLPMRFIAARMTSPITV